MEKEFINKNWNKFMVELWKEKEEYLSENKYFKSFIKDLENNKYASLYVAFAKFYLDTESKNINLEKTNENDIQYFIDEIFDNCSFDRENHAYYHISYINNWRKPDEKILSNNY